MKTTPNKATALETFEARRDAVAKLARKFATAIENYDRQVSIAGDHSNWEHAGTLAHVEELMGRALDSLTGATVSTHAAARRTRTAR
jgi:hypothetical protein